MGFSEIQVIHFTTLPTTDSTAFRNPTSALDKRRKFMGNLIYLPTWMSPQVEI